VSSADHPIPFTPWADFMAAWDWTQGEHVTIVGPTGTGKTTLMRALMVKRYQAGGAVAVLATKPRDVTLERWARADHLAVVRSWPPRAPRFRRPADIELPDGRTVAWDHRVMLWPRTAEASTFRSTMEREHRAALDAMFVQGGWCIAAEELLYLCADLGLDDALTTLWTQGRSNGISVIGGTQRPVNIPLYAYSQASHLFMFGDSDDVNLSRLQGIGGMDGKNLRGLVKALPHHDVLYIGTRNRTLVRTRVPVRKAGR